jgi:hypothetical protein
MWRVMKLKMIGLAFCKWRRVTEVTEPVCSRNCRNISVEVVKTLQEMVSLPIFGQLSNATQTLITSPIDGMNALNWTQNFRI